MKKSRTTSPKTPIAAGVRRVGARVAQRGPASLRDSDLEWVEGEPQNLWGLLDGTIAACTAAHRDEQTVRIGLCLLSNQLELIRYHLERGHAWAREMLDTYQEKLIALAKAGTLSESDWFALVKALKEAKVPLRQEMTDALLQAAVDGKPGSPMPEGMPPPEELLRQLRGMIDELGWSAEDPFEVVDGVDDLGTLMPGEMTAFLTHELGLSPRPVLREAVPLLLLSPAPEVRRAAAAVLEQIAVPETFSPIMLRRTILARNWVPAPEREAIDRTVRKARVKGVACAQWAPAPHLAIQSTVIDGSGAQSFMLSTPKGRTGVFGALLFKQGFGVRDVLFAGSMPRRDISAAVSGLKERAVSLGTDRGHLDTVVQHHIARGLASGNLPQIALVEVAEAIGASAWMDQAIDVAAETERLFGGLPAQATTEAGIAMSLQRICVPLMRGPMLESWFEDDADVRALVEGKPRPKPEASVLRMLTELLPARRDVWVERLLLQALWLRAGDSARIPGGAWADYVVLAHELLAGRRMADLPPMVLIAERSVEIARLW